MKPDFIFALYVFCCEYHSGQSSRLYRILSRIANRGIKLSDRSYDAIRNQEVGYKNDEWFDARAYYQELVQKYALDSK